MRLALIGAGSFIARQVLRVVQSSIFESIEAFPVPHGADLDRHIAGADVIVNFALSPEFLTSPYTEQNDADLKAARAAQRAGARFIMLSTRRVYPPSERWGAGEECVALGDETLYGRNKAASERFVRDCTNGTSVILRLSNIIGFEYERERLRRTFMAMALRSLQTVGKISFDMSPAVRRDFLPVEICAERIVQAASNNRAGIFNLGAGFPLACGDIAEAVIRGFGRGDLDITKSEDRDAFYLDTAKWNSIFPTRFTKSDLINYCENLGRRLRDA
jgi:dTDP-4-dehydrorhamnose reductase/UDP-glucose 4-epimerase